MKYFLWAGLILFAIGIQGSLSFFDITPNFTVILACHAGIRHGPAKGLLLGSLVGVIEDSLSGFLLGPHLLGKGLTGYVAAFLASKFFGWTSLLGALVVTSLTLADGIIVYAARSIFGTSPASIGTAAFIIAIQSLFNAPFGFLLKKKSE